MTKMLYIQGDLSSSPYEPMTGAIILYRPPQNSSNGLDLRPGIITHVHGTKDDRVDITVFTPQGVVHVCRVPYSMDPIRHGTWQWCKQPERREVSISAPSQKNDKSSDSTQHSPSGEGGETIASSNSDSPQASKEAVPAG